MREQLKGFETRIKHHIREILTDQTLNQEHKQTRCVSQPVIQLNLQLNVLEKLPVNQKVSIRESQGKNRVKLDIQVAKSALVKDIKKQQGIDSTKSIEESPLVGGKRNFESTKSKR